MLVLFKVSDGDIQNLRFQFAKNEDGWYVANTLHGNQLAQAHPLSPPTPKSYPQSHCEYIIAQRIENDAQQNYPNDYIKKIHFSDGRGHTKYNRATQKVGYRLGSGQKVKHHFFCEKQDEKWVIAKELASNEYVDFETGEILQRKK